MKFYWSPRPRYLDLITNITQYLEESRESEIEDTDLFETSIRVDGDETYGTLLVNDFGKVIDSSPDGYSEGFAKYKIVCFAYNQFTFSTKELGYYSNPDYSDDFLSFVNVTYPYNA
jgi:hypothetical protein